MTPEDEYFERQLIESLENQAERMREIWEEAKLLCESPIERRMFAALLNNNEVVDDCAFAIIGPMTEPRWAQRHAVEITPQLQIGKHRVDFGVSWWRYGTGRINVAVECDGHEFHEKTKQQARRDKEPRPHPSARRLASSAFHWF